MNRQLHVQTLLFLLLFLIFVIGSFFIVSSEIQGYQNIHESIVLEDDLTTPLAYMNTKLKAYDQKNGVERVIYKGVPCLKLNDDQTTTYIFFKDGYLQELSVSQKYNPSLDEGEKLFQLDDMQVTLENQLCIVKVHKNHQSKQLAIYLHG